MTLTFSITIDFMRESKGNPNSPVCWSSVGALDEMEARLPDSAQHPTLVIDAQNEWRLQHHAEWAFGRYALTDLAEQRRHFKQDQPKR
jgi:hypothetical protein